MLALKVNLQVLYWRIFLVGWKLKYAPDGLYRSNVSALQVLGDLVIGASNLHRCPIRAFVNVLVDVLYSLHSSTDLYIYMRTILLQEVWVVRNNPSVVTNDLFARGSTLRSCKGPSIIATTVFWISIIMYSSPFTKGFREPFLASRTTPRRLANYAWGLQVILAI